MLKLQPQAEVYNPFNKNDNTARTRFPFLIGAEFGRYFNPGNESGKFNMLSFFLDVNLSSHWMFLKFEYGHMFRPDEKSRGMFLVGLNFTPLKQRYHKVYVSFNVGLAAGKGFPSFIVGVSPKYLFAVSDYFGLSGGLKYLYTGSHIIGLNFGIQFFEN